MNVPDSVNQLEFAKVVRLVVGKTQTEYGRELALALTPLTDKEAICAALEEAAEAGKLLEDAGPLALGSGLDLLPHLARLNTAGVRLEAAALLEVGLALETAAGCRKRLRERDECPRLQQLALGLTAVPELASQIRRSIGPRAEILDTASFELAELRESLRRERGRLKRQLEGLLHNDALQGVFQESLVTDRNGRYVLPVRADHAGRIKGFVHDVSASGQTHYLEPAVCLDGNNRVQQLLHEIEREQQRILLRLSDAVRSVCRQLSENQAILARLDLRQAIARLGARLDATIPELATTPLLEVTRARHPLLIVSAEAQASRVVPVDLNLPQECYSLIISGPNTGGKTLALKTAGLLVLMMRAGLPIPCAPGSRLFPFAPVMADIGDEQSIEQSLSTFSGHLLRLRGILERADGNTLVLMDELGTGTDPGEGSALALAAVDHLRRVGARIMATTHLHVVKGYAQLEEGVENAAVEFDPETLQPSYRLHYGIPGASHAFTIARRLGLPEAVLSAAQGYLGRNESEGLAIIERLQELRATLDEELQQAQRLRRSAEREQQGVRRRREELDERRQAILEDTRRQGVKLLAQAEQQLKGLLERAASAQLPSRERARLTRELRQLRADLPAPPPQGPEQVAGEIVPGELLFVPALGAEAEVSAVDGDRVELLAGGKKLRQPKTSLRQYQPRRFAKRGRPQPKLRDRVERKAFMPRLVVVGQRVEEACDALDRFLDEALLHGESSLEVVHGAGQGILRKAVREFLAARRDVQSYSAAAVEQGGDNVTVVELRA
jgi:DNA mismatch repair protein MutS2